jgi:hypothetical protein
MSIPSCEQLKAKLPHADIDLKCRMEKLQASLRHAYKTVSEANRKSHRTNKRYYDRRAKRRSFVAGDYVYLYNPARRPGKSSKFNLPWAGPFLVLEKISDLNYAISGSRDKKMVVHINRFKFAHGVDRRERDTRLKRKARWRTKSPTVLSDDESADIKIGAFPLVHEDRQRDNVLPNQGTAVRDSSPTLDASGTPVPRRDLDYRSEDTPRSRREMQDTRTEPPITRSRSRAVDLAGSE